MCTNVVLLSRAQALNQAQRKGQEIETSKKCKGAVVIFSYICTHSRSVYKPLSSCYLLVYLSPCDKRLRLITSYSMSLFFLHFDIFVHDVHCKRVGTILKVMQDLRNKQANQSFCVKLFQNFLRHFEMCSACCFALE